MVIDMANPSAIADNEKRVSQLLVDVEDSIHRGDRIQARSLLESVKTLREEIFEHRKLEEELQTARSEFRPHAAQPTSSGLSVADLGGLSHAVQVATRGINRPADLPVFRGGSEDVRKFYLDFKIKIAPVTTDPVKIMAVLVGQLQGPARSFYLLWKAGRKRDGLPYKLGVVPVKEFKAALFAHFYGRIQVADLRAKYESLKMTDNVQTYCDNFMVTMHELGIADSDGDAIRRFKRGLSLRFRTVLVTHAKCGVESVAELIDAVLQIHADQRDLWLVGSAGTEEDVRKCYGCGKRGHIQDKCPDAKPGAKVVKSKFVPPEAKGAEVNVAELNMEASSAEVFGWEAEFDQLALADEDVLHSYEIDDSA